MIVTAFNAFFIFTLLVSLAVVSLGSSGATGGVWSNEAYEDKAALIGLYAYLLEAKAIRVPSSSYLMIATVTEGRKKKLAHQESQVGGNNDDSNVVQAKLMKSLDRKIANLTQKVEKQLKDI